MESNKKILSILSGVVASTAFFYLFASGGSILAGNLLFPSKDFGENTYIGPYDVSDFKEPETVKVLSEGVTDLEGRFDVSIIYQDASIQLPKEAVSYDVDSTIDNASSGQENPMLAQVNEEAVHSLLSQNFGELGFTEQELSAITDGIERRLRSGTMPAKIQITDFMDAGRLSGADQVASSSFSGQPVSGGLLDAMAALDGYQIEAGSSVSFIQMLESTENGTLTEIEMTRIASVLYATVLNTNFIIDERSISDRLPEEIPVGYEAAINILTGMDFKFTNPNGSAFTIRTDVTGDSLTIALEGLPLMYDYSTSVTGLENFDPRTIKQFSENVRTVSPRIDEEGEAGVRVTVLKHVSEGSIEQSVEEVSTDFYAPVHRIEVHRLKPKEQPAAEKGEGEESGGNDDGSGKTDTTDSESDNDNAETGDGAGSGSGNSGGSGSGSSGNPDGQSDSGNGSGGSPSDNDNPDQPGEDEIIYDKGGNPVEP
ncbi:MULTISPECIES: VanW family protein [Bhargavaea]|uniref:VanW family protein n=1 Tax=Bhargavaea changchunensis TaxID=2134037 RepID=A0ABW2NF68_9BACL|nr:VanW family protein [Bhargavaea sp. CC-171006]